MNRPAPLLDQSTFVFLVRQNRIDSAQRSSCPGGVRALGFVSIYRPLGCIQGVRFQGWWLNALGRTILIVAALAILSVRHRAGESTRLIKRSERGIG